jgi:predicted CoA-binding protein
MPEPLAVHPLVYDDDLLRGILRRVRTIAMVGASAQEMRPSYFAMLYLRNKGYHIYPVNPRYLDETIQGEKVYRSLAELPERPDMVQIFRRSEEVGPVVEAAVALGVPVIWMQLGVRNDAVAAWAAAQGATVVMDRCPKIEYGRLFGEIGWLGVNRGVLTSKRGEARQLRTRKGGLGPA